MGGWYAATGLYWPEELGGLSVRRFCQALAAEGGPGCNKALHLHPLFNTVDVYGQGKPTRIANLPADMDIRQPLGSPPSAEGIQEGVFFAPWFKHCRTAAIEEYADAFRKVIDHTEELLPDDPGTALDGGQRGLSRRRQT